MYIKRATIDGKSKKLNENSFLSQTSQILVNFFFLNFVELFNHFIKVKCMKNKIKCIGEEKEFVKQN